MKLNATSAYTMLFGLAMLANPSAQSATPADSAGSITDALIDTRLFADAEDAGQDASVDTRLNIVDFSPGWAKIDTLTPSGTLLLIR
jgi:hypothetical protein